MRTPLVVAGLLICSVLSGTEAMTSPAPGQAAGATTMTMDAITRRIMQAEAALTVRMMAFRPIIEVYAQHVRPNRPTGEQADRRTGRATKDDYFLGGFEWSDQTGPKMTRLIADNGVRRQITDWLTQRFGVQLKFEGFAAMAVPDWRLLDGRHHSFTYLRREPLGETRCLVLDVVPADPANGFTGRIWVEDREFNIVRFNGITRSPTAGKSFWFSVDSWRANVRPGIWLPSYIYSELQGADDAVIKSHVRLWGYALKPYRSEPDTAPPVTDVLERLSNAGLLAPHGDLDTVLSTVVTNLQLTNNLTPEPVSTRVLLTSPLHSFSVGRTIVVSRGLIDVLPDEASLATVLAHELAHIMLGHANVPAQLVSDTPLPVPDDELLPSVTPRYTPQEEEAANRRMIELLKNSPYKDKLSEAGLFLRAVSENAKTLKALIQSHISGYAGSEAQAHRLADIKQPTAAALPLGSRVVMDPWTNSLELAQMVNAPATSTRDHASLAVTPLVPPVRYAEVKR